MTSYPLAPPFPSPTGPGTASRTELPAPQIPDHELLRCIGSGSYGKVWLARNALGVCRAVKIVYRHSFEDERPYEREFGGIKKFEPISRSHEGLVDILQVGRNDAAGYFYYVMELADDANQLHELQKLQELHGDDLNPTQGRASRLPLGGREGQGEGARISVPAQPSSYTPKTLRTEIKQRGKLPVEECVQLSLSLTDALRHLHDHGLVHRDIKPSNIIFVNNTPKLADIGLVTEAGETLSLVGTEGYIPPEGPGTPAADLFSLGKVLYEISTGKDRRAYPEPPTNLVSLQDRDPLLEFNEVVFKACAPDPRHRYQLARQMHEDVLLLQRGASIKRLRYVERRLALATKIAGVVLVLALLAGAAWFQASRAKKKATHRLIRSNVANAVRLMNEGDLARALPWVAETLRLAEGDPVEETIQRYRFEAIWRHCPKLIALSTHESRINDAAFSPRGRRFVTVSADKTARIWDATTGEPLTAPLVHDTEILLVAFGPDGSRVITASQDAVLRIWNATTGQLVAAPIQLRLQIHSISFSPDGSRILTSSGAVRGDSRDGITERQSADGKYVIGPWGTPMGEAQVWNALTGEPLLASLPHAGRVYEAHFSSDGQRIITASEDHTAILWDASTGKPLLTFRHAGKVRQARFSPDDRRVFTASEDETGQLWDAQTGQPVGEPLRHAKALLNAAFSPDGQKIVTASRDQTARLWDLATGRAIGLPLLHNSEVRHAVFSPDGRWVVTAASEEQVRLWDAKTGELLAQLAHNNSGTLAAFSPDSAHLLTISRDRLARVWDLSPLSSPAITLPHDDLVLSAQFSPDGAKLLTASADQAARFWDSIRGEPLSAPLKQPGQNSRISIFTVRFSPDGGRFIAAGYSVRLYDTTTATLLNCFTNPRPSISAFSPDGHFVLTTSQEGIARLFDPTTGEPAGPPMQHPARIWCAAFSPDSRWIVTGYGDVNDPSLGGFRVWDARSGQCLAAISLRGIVRTACFSPDGRAILTACTNPPKDEREAQLWDWQRAKQRIPPLRHNDGVSSAEFSPDGSAILTASFDKTARLWDAGSGLPLGPPLSHDRQVERAVFSPDGLRILTASVDGTARIWFGPTGEPISPPLKHNGPVWNACFSPDGQRVVTCSEDRTARIWHLPENVRPVSDLLAMAELLSGQRIDTSGSLTPIGAKELLQRWQALRQKYPGDFGRPRGEWAKVLDWNSNDVVQEWPQPTQ